MTEENINQSQGGLSSSSEINRNRYNDDSIDRSSSNSRYNGDYEPLRQVINYEEQFLDRVRNTQLNRGSNIGRGTYLIQNRPNTEQRIRNEMFQSFQDFEQRQRQRDRARRAQDKRSKKELVMVYKKIAHKIPQEWRIEDLS